MRRAWTLIAFSAGCDLVGAIFTQILAVHSLLNPLTHLAWWSRPNADAIRHFGFVLGGTCRFALLAMGLVWALKVYRQAGLLARLRGVDWVLLSTMGVYVAVEFRSVAVALRSGVHFAPVVMLGWPTDPLLWLLLAQALLLYRSVQQAGGGWIGRSWMAFSIGIFLVSLGDVSNWASTWGYLPWPWSSFEWYVWLPAAGAFALAPAYQCEAIVSASVRPPQTGHHRFN